MLKAPENKNVGQVDVPLEIFGFQHIRTCAGGGKIEIYSG
jgi:hypothetical protein